MAGRIRSVKPEWLDDERLAHASLAARVLSIGLLLIADDHGRGRAHPVDVGANVFRAEADPRGCAEKALAELEAIEFIVLYTVRGQSYFAIRNWAKHQRVDKPGAPRVPPPSEADAPQATKETSAKSQIRESLANIPEGLANVREDGATGIVSVAGQAPPPRGEPNPTSTVGRSSRALAQPKNTGQNANSRDPREALAKVPGDLATDLRSPISDLRSPTTDQWTAKGPTSEGGRGDLGKAVVELLREELGKRFDAIVDPHALALKLLEKARSVAPGAPDRREVLRAAARDVGQSKKVERVESLLMFKVEQYREPGVIARLAAARAAEVAANDTDGEDDLDDFLNNLPRGVVHGP